MSTEGTRERIQQVALELFGEQGYDKTSLREIAERLEVTKAALYYHFKSKEAILESLLEDHLSEIEKLVAWAADRPGDVETRQQFVERYATIVVHRAKVMRFLQQGSSALKDSDMGRRFKESMKRVNEILRDEDAPLVDQVRALGAVLSIHVGSMVFGAGSETPFGPGGDHDPAEVHAAVTQVAQEMIAANGPRPT